MIQQEVGIFEAKSQFSKIIEKAEHGIEYVITRRGKPVAKIIPFEQREEMTFEEMTERLTKIQQLYHSELGQ
jgi:prevent-host-death family protein